MWAGGAVSGGLDAARRTLAPNGVALTPMLSDRDLAALPQVKQGFGRGRPSNIG